MKSWRFSISSPNQLWAGAITWQIAQVFWVGGLWLLHFVWLPALAKLGFAPVLVQEVTQYTRSVLVGLVLVCVVLQLIVLMQVLPSKRLLKDSRGQLLLVALVLAGAFLLLKVFLPDAQYAANYSYLVLGLSGLFLVIQPIPRQQPI